MPNASFRDDLHGMTLDALYAGLSALAVLGIFEALEPGFVSRFFNLTWLVVWSLAASFLAFFTHPPDRPGVESKGAPLLFLGGLVGAWAVWQGLPPELSSYWRIAASLATLIVAMLMLVLTKKPR